VAAPGETVDSGLALRAAHEAVQDALLVERVRQGDERAFGELVGRYMRPAFSVAFRILAQREDAEDVVQDCFIRVLERLESFERGRPFRPWFFRIVVNQALNARRGRGRRSADALPEQLAATGASPETDTERALLRRRLLSALETLPEKQATIVMLADVEGFTSAEIAEIFEISAGTVRWHLHQARAALRTELEPLQNEEP
jgi:RNA polymerase sigma-70 factor, ECF subfamily